MSDYVYEVEKRPGEEFVLTANFEDVLGGDETIISVAVSATDSGGIAAAGILDGAAQANTPRALQKIQAGTDGEDYTIVVSATTSAGNVYDQRFLLRVRAEALTAPTITTTGINANCYVTLAEADSYFVGRLRSDAWGRASRRDRSKALIQATREIDRIDLKGSRYNTAYDVAQPTKLAQPLKFPRDYTTDGVGAAYVPLEVKQAVYEQAIHLLASGAAGERRARLQAQGVASFAVEGMSETFNARRGRALPTDHLCAEAAELLRRHVDWSVRLVRGAAAGLDPVTRAVREW